MTKFKNLKNSNLTLKFKLFHQFSDVLLEWKANLFKERINAFNWIKERNMLILFTYLIYIYIYKVIKNFKKKLNRLLLIRIIKKKYNFIIIMFYRNYQNNFKYWRQFKVIFSFSLVHFLVLPFMKNL